MASSTESKTSGSFRQSASPSVEVQLFNFIWWFIFVLDGVLSDWSETIVSNWGTIYSLQFNLIPELETLGTIIIHFGYEKSI
jgi:hypothetical protein